MDVTKQILKHHEVYGGSDNTSQSYTSAGRCLNYANGPTIQRPIEYGVSVFPFRMDLKGEVGLFGTENIFIKFNINVIDSGNFCVEEPGWLCGMIDQQPQPVYPQDNYTLINNQALVDFETPEEDPDYDSAILSNPSYLQRQSRKFSFYLQNNKTGNIYVDSHVDGRLYSIDRQERPYELMYVATKDCVYVGIHARNTKRLPFDMTVSIGYEAIGQEVPMPPDLESPCCSATATVRY